MGARNILIGVALPHLPNAVFEHRAIRDDTALFGSPRAKLALQRSRGEVGVRFALRDQFGSAIDPDLTHQLPPPETEGASGIFGKLPSLPTPVVGEEDKSVLVEPFQQNDPH